MANPAGERGGLPDVVFDCLPSDPFEQLEWSRLISVLAFQNQVAKLESESNAVKTTGVEKEKKIRALETRVEELEEMLVQASNKLAASLEEQAKLMEDKNVLTLNVKKLNRDVAKLEAFRRTLMQSLQDEDSQEAPVSGGGDDKRPFASVVASASATLHARSISYSDTQVEDGEQPVQAVPSVIRGTSFGSSVSFSSQATPGSMTAKSNSKQLDASCGPDIELQVKGMYSGEDDGSSIGAGTGKPMQQQSLPVPTLSVSRGLGKPSASAGAAASSDAVPITTLREDEASMETDARNPPRAINIPLRGGTPSLTPHLTPSVTPTGSPRRSNSTEGTRTPRVDGKEFFRQARNRLSYEQFSSFLANIKELNAHRASREDTLRKADEIFGADNKDLYVSFEALLTRHLPS